jgi:tetratricopeptide (TPR) repeat protein
MSQLLQRLERELRSSQPGSIRHAELTAQRAGYLARVGRFDEAKQAVAELRKVFGDGHSGPVTVWIMLAETLILYYESLQPGAMDRVKRAQFLSQLMQDRPLIALTSAWKANVEFETSRFDDMFASLSAVRAHLQPTDHAAGARFSMVLLNLFMNCGEFEAAQKWFMRCREHALSEGDQATIEAMLYNRAAYRMAWLRAQSCFGKLGDAEITQTQLELSSSRNYHDIVQVKGLADLLDLCEARVHVLAGSYEKAISALESIRTSKQFASHNFNQRLIDLEIAYCHLGLGNIDAALKSFAAVADLDMPSLDVDEQLRASWMLNVLAGADPRFGDAKATQAQFDATAAAYHRMIDTLKVGLQDYRVDA